MEKKKILVAMSGGVDSSAAAFLLREQGCAVVGVTLRLWHSGDDKSRPGGCCSIEDIADARRVCNFLGIRHYVLNLEKEFQDRVVENFVQEYLHARTPNPCIVCNEKIKFDLLLNKARSLGFDAMATGHYARIEGKKEKDAIQYYLRQGRDPAKDQSYVLYQLTQKELAFLLFPLGRHTKQEIRKIAEKQRIPVAHKPDSQEICFIHDDYASFLKAHVRDFDRRFRPGPIVDARGKVLGQHRGIPFYTVGQRSGLGLTSPVPLYVTRIDARRNRLNVGEKEATFSKEFLVEKVTWVAGRAPSLPLQCDVKIRRQHAPAAATLTRQGKKIRVKFKLPQLAITPGQSAVFYQREYVLGGGIIDRSKSR